MLKDPRNFSPKELNKFVKEMSADAADEKEWKITGNVGPDSYLVMELQIQLGETIKDLLTPSQHRSGGKTSIPVFQKVVS